MKKKILISILSLSLISVVVNLHPLPPVDTDTTGETDEGGTTTTYAAYKTINTSDIGKKLSFTDGTILVKNLDPEEAYTSYYYYEVSSAPISVYFYKNTSGTSKYKLEYKYVNRCSSYNGVGAGLEWGSSPNIGYSSASAYVSHSSADVGKSFSLMSNSFSLGQNAAINYYIRVYDFHCADISQIVLWKAQ